MKLDIYYDGECPFCSSFVKMSRLKSMYDVSLFNLRDLPDKAEDFAKRGCDVDEGMIVQLNDEIYFGYEAVHIIAVLSNENKVLGRVYNLLFSNRVFVRFLYPFMRAGRNFTLFLLRRDKIKT